jgi:hypothetical protein
VLLNADEDVGAVSVVDLGALDGTVCAMGWPILCEALFCEGPSLSDGGVGLAFLADANFSATILCETNLARGVDGPFVFLRRCNGDLTRAAAWRAAVELASGDDIAGRLVILLGDTLVSALCLGNSIS